jgi:mannose-6-phosphate isomerase-like protein (cupin superfamily)
MSGNIIQDGKYIKHSTDEGVFVKHYFGLGDNDRLNNVEILIIPGHQISPHKHDNSTEFFYVASGQGEFLDGDEWKPIKKSDAFKAPIGRTHGIMNSGIDMLVLLAAFSPPIR